MCSYEKAGWPGYRDLGFCDRDLGNRAGNFFRYKHSSSDTGTVRDETILRASSYEPGRPGWLGFRDLASPLFSLQKLRFVHMRRRAGPVTEFSVFATEILEIFPIWTLQPGYWDWPRRNNFNWAWLVSSLTSQGNCFYTGLTSRFPYSGCFCICVEASWINVMLSRTAGPRVFWAFRAFFISVTGIKFPIWTEDKNSSRLLGQPGNWAHMKRPLVCAVRGQALVFEGP